MRKSSCRRSLLATVVPTTVKLWNRSAVSKQQSAARTNLHVLLNPPARLRLQSHLLSGSAKRAVEPSQGPPISPRPLRHASDLATATVSKSGHSRSRNHSGGVSRSGLRRAAKARVSSRSCWRLRPQTPRPGCSRDEDGWEVTGPSLAPAWRPSSAAGGAVRRKAAAFQLVPSGGSRSIASFSPTPVTAAARF